MNHFIEMTSAILHKVRLYLLLAIVMLMPISKKAIPPLIILYVIAWLIDCKREVFSVKVFKDKFFIIPVLFYIFHILGLTYTDNMKSGWFDLEVKLSLLVFPVLVFSAPQFHNTGMKKILLGFVLGNMLSGLLCLFYGAYRTFRYASAFPNYEDFSVFMHTSYSSMYFLFSIGILSALLIRNNYYSYKKEFWLILACVLFFISLIYLNSSRAGLIALLGIAVYLLFYLRKNLKIKYLSWIGFLVAVSVTGMLLFPNPRIKEAVEFIKMPKDSLEPATANGSVIRYLMMIEAVHLCKENILSGVGTGDVKDELEKKYTGRNIILARDKHLNAHNQFLETFIGLGLPGFILLLSLTLIPLYFAVKNENLLPGMFSVIIIVNFVFESMLNTQAGVVFYSLFYSLLMVNKNNKDIY